MLRPGPLSAADPVRFLGRLLPGGVPGLRDVVRRGLVRAFGPPSLDVAAHRGDPGLFGPDSASWRVIGEHAAIVGGIRALVTQLLHPLAMAGVADHSRFREDTLGRLQRTSSYVTIATFGALDEVLAVTRSVRAGHRRVRGTAPDGRAYRADDPHLLAWVSVALTSSFLAADAAYAARPLRGDDADRFVSEQSQAAALLDPRVDLDALDPDRLRRGRLRLPLLAEGHLPTTVGELDAALDRFEPELAVGTQGREAFAFLRRPPIPGPLLAGYVPLLAGALATLPPAHRALLDVPMGRSSAAATRAQVRAMLAGMRTVAGEPLSLAAARRRVAA